MIPATYDLEHNANGDFQFVFNLAQPSTNGIPPSVQNLGLPFVLSSFTSAILQVRSGPTQSSPLIFTFSTNPLAGQGTLLLGGVTGTVTTSAAASLWDSITPGEYFYDLVLLNMATTLCVVQGGFQLNSGVTAS